MITTTTITTWYLKKNGKDLTRTILNNNNDNNNNNNNKTMGNSAYQTNLKSCVEVNSAQIQSSINYPYYFYNKCCVVNVTYQIYWLKIYKYFCFNFRSC